MRPDLFNGSITQIGPATPRAAIDDPAYAPEYVQITGRVRIRADPEERIRTPALPALLGRATGIPTMARRPARNRGPGQNVHLR